MTQFSSCSFLVCQGIQQEILLFHEATGLKLAWGETCSICDWSTVNKYKFIKVALIVVIELVA